MAHTRGPWTASQYLDTHEWGVITDNNEIVVGLDSRISAENASLIAAAPELLDALVRLVNEASGFKSMADPFVHGHTNMAVLGLRIDEARAVIAKAEGKQ
jgi:hypothetical protein